MELQELVKACRNNERSAQKMLYDRYAALFLSICQRYLKDRGLAEDAMIEAFYSIFVKIKAYKGLGSFEGWMKRIVVTTCLMKLRKRKLSLTNIDEVHDPRSQSADPESQLFEKDLLQLLNKLPDGYRTVFNLYAIEGYKHREIAQMLEISINTSKSQLIQARKKLSDLIEEQGKGKNYGSRK